MADTMPAARRRLEVSVGDPQGTLGLIGEARTSSPANWTAADAEAARWFLRIVDRAMERTGSFKAVCAALKQDRSLTRRQLDGDGHLSAARLAMLGDDFWLNVADELRIHFGMLDKAGLIAQAEALSDRARQLFAQAAQR